MEVAREVMVILRRRHGGHRSENFKIWSKNTEAKLIRQEVNQLLAELS